LVKAVGIGIGLIVLMTGVVLIATAPTMEMWNYFARRQPGLENRTVGFFETFAIFWVIMRIGASFKPSNVKVNDT